jgi:hypothetical protein
MNTSLIYPVLIVTILVAFPRSVVNDDLKNDILLGMLVFLFVMIVNEHLRIILE